MNKYELTVVVSANVEDEVRVNTVEQVKELVARFGGVISNVEDCGKKRLAYEIGVRLVGSEMCIRDRVSSCHNPQH